MNGADLKAFLDVSERSRALVEAYFNLKTHLYFDFTHLVCREAVNGENLSRDDLSHPVHADNCLLKPDGSCVRERPAYIYRDYSAILYLNDDFTGGEFFFAHNNLSTQYLVTPKCGRLVAFDAALYHGVKAVLNGRRCAVAMWYTLDANQEEVSRVQAERLLKSLEEKQSNYDAIKEGRVKEGREKEIETEEGGVREGRKITMGTEEGSVREGMKITMGIEEGSVREGMKITMGTEEGSMREGRKITMGTEEGSVREGMKITMGTEEGSMREGRKITMGTEEGSMREGMKITMGTEEGNVREGMKITIGTEEGSVRDWRKMGSVIEERAKEALMAKDGTKQEEMVAEEVMMEKTTVEKRIVEGEIVEDLVKPSVQKDTSSKDEL